MSLRWLAALFFLWHVSLAAQPARPHALKVALFDVEPYAHLVKGKPQGHYVKLVRELLAAEGYEADIRVLPFARVALTLDHGEADLTLGFSTQALERAGEPLGVVALVDSVVVARASRNLRPVKDLRGLQVGRARGGCRDLADQPELGIHWTEVIGFDSALRMLDLGRLEAVCLTRQTLQHHREALGIAPGRLGTELVVGQRQVVLFARKGLQADAAAQLKRRLKGRSPLRLE